jgi:hypothetical protein
MLSNERMDEEVASALPKTTEDLFRVVTEENYYDREFWIGSQKVGNDRQATIRRVVDFEETEIGLFYGNRLGDLVAAGNGVEFSARKVRQMTAQKWS